MDLEKSISQVAGSKLSDVGIAMNVLMLSFCRENEGIDGYLHIQSGWQLIYERQVVLGSLDVIEPGDDAGKSRLSEALKQCNSILNVSQPVVTSVDLKEFLGVDVVLNKGWRVSAFTLNAESVAGSDRELWRIENFTDGLSIVAELGGVTVSSRPKRDTGLRWARRILNRIKADKEKGHTE